MKAVIVKFSQLGTDCWSPRRVTGGCFTCERVERCKLSEAQDGRIEKRRRGVEYAYEQLKRAEDRLQKQEQNKGR